MRSRTRHNYSPERRVLRPGEAHLSAAGKWQGLGGNQDVTKQRPNQKWMYIGPSLVASQKDAYTRRDKLLGLKNDRGESPRKAIEDSKNPNSGAHEERDELVAEEYSLIAKHNERKSGILGLLKDTYDDSRTIEVAPAETLATPREKQATSSVPIYDHTGQRITVGLLNKAVDRWNGKEPISCSLRFQFLSKIENLVNMKNLQALDLSANNIRKIENLKNVPRLTTLRLDGCEIEKIENLDHLVNLKTLHLEHNAIKVIEGLKSFKCLEYLNLSGNKINKLGLLGLTGSVDVETDDMNSAREPFISRDPTNAPREPNTARSTASQIISMSVSAPSSTKPTPYSNGLFPLSLTELHLSNNNLTELGHAFHGLLHLKILALNDNHLGEANLHDNSMLETPRDLEAVVDNLNSARSSRSRISTARTARSIGGSSNTSHIPMIQQLLGKADVKGTEARRPDFMPLHKSLRELSALTDLELDGNGLTDLSFLVTTRYRGEMGKLKTDTSKGNMMRATTMPKLNSLSVNRNAISDFGLPYNVAMSSLKDIYIAENRIRTICSGVGEWIVDQSDMESLGDMSARSVKTAGSTTVGSEGIQNEANSSSSSNHASISASSNQASGKRHDEQSGNAIMSSRGNINSSRSPSKTSMRDGGGDGASSSSKATGLQSAVPSTGRSGTAASSSGGSRCFRNPFPKLEVLDMSSNYLDGDPREFVERIGELFGENLVELYVRDNPIAAINEQTEAIQDGDSARGEESTRSGLTGGQAQPALKSERKEELFPLTIGMEESESSKAEKEEASTGSEIPQESSASNKTKSAPSYGDPVLQLTDGSGIDKTEVNSKGELVPVQNPSAAANSDNVVARAGDLSASSSQGVIPQLAMDLVNSEDDTTFSTRPEERLSLFDEIVSHRSKHFKRLQMLDDDPVVEPEGDFVIGLARRAIEPLPSSRGPEADGLESVRSETGKNDTGIDWKSELPSSAVTKEAYRETYLKLQQLSPASRELITVPGDEEWEIENAFLVEEQREKQMLKPISLELEDDDAAPNTSDMFLAECDESSELSTARSSSRTSARKSKEIKEEKPFSVSQLGSRRFMQERQLKEWTDDLQSTFHAMEQEINRIVQDGAKSLSRMDSAIKETEEVLKREEELQAKRVLEEIEEEKASERVEDILAKDTLEMDKLAFEEFSKWKTDLTREAEETRNSAMKDDSTRGEALARQSRLAKETKMLSHEKPASSFLGGASSPSSSSVSKLLPSSRPWPSSGLLSSAKKPVTGTESGSPVKRSPMKKVAPAIQQDFSVAPENASRWLPSDLDRKPVAAKSEAPPYVDNGDDESKRPVVKTDELIDPKPRISRTQMQIKTRKRFERNRALQEAAVLPKVDPDTPEPGGDAKNDTLLGIPLITKEESEEHVK